MNKDFSDFQRFFKEYQKRFGLNGWQVYFKHESMEECYARISIGHGLQVATARLNSELPEKNRPHKDIKESAKHEAIHLLLGRLEGNARFRYIIPEEITESVEELVVKLEGLISD